jgi:hypothetical protein
MKKMNTAPEAFEISSKSTHAWRDSQKEKRETERIFEEIMAEIFSKLMENIKFTHPRSSTKPK